MSTDIVKDALVASFPGTKAKDWKRRSKGDGTNGISREFENVTTGVHVITLEKSDGTVDMLRSWHPSNPAPLTTQVVSLAEAPELPPEQRPTKAKAPAKPKPPKVDQSMKNLMVPGSRWRVKQDFNIDLHYTIERLQDSDYAKSRFETVATIKEGFEFTVADKMKTGQSVNFGDKYVTSGLMVPIQHDDADRITLHPHRTVFQGRHPLMIWDDLRLPFNQIGLVIEPPHQTTPKAERNQMVPKSKWEFHRECQLTMWVSNPERDKLIEARYPHGGEGRDPEIEAMPVCVPMRVATIPAGTQFTVAGKSESSDQTYGDDDRKFSNGLVFPVQLPEGHAIEFHLPMGRGHEISSPLYYWHDADFVDRKLYLPFVKIAEHISPLNIPETPVFVLRDTATGELFGGWEQEPVPNYPGSTRTGDIPKMVTRLSSAKKYATESAAKASIREFIGYNEGLDDYLSDESGAYYLTGGSKKMDLPASWELVSFDKTTGAELRRIDVQEWLKGLMRLRVLTVRYGTAARSVYKKAEGKGLDAIVVFSSRSRGFTYDNRPYDEPCPFDDQSDDTILRQIEDASKMMGGKTYREKAASNIAYACDTTDAFVVQMAFDHPLVRVTVLDFTTLEEVVKDQP